jgi:predicted RNA-binding Zn ribbon-like protein
MTFSFHRGSLALDFAGTVGSRTSAEPEERLPDAGALAAWLREARLVEGVAPTARELALARKLREAVYDLGAAIVAERPLDARALAILNTAVAGVSRGAPRLDRKRQIHWVTKAPLALALGRIALDAIERFAAEADRLTLCELSGCGALLLSRSRSDRRRWCSMDLCGNRAKVAAYRSRMRTKRELGV